MPGRIRLALIVFPRTGHLRDVRRLVVALSRSRLGCYVFGRKALFENCIELAPSFNIMAKTGDKMVLALGEKLPTERPAAEAPATEKRFEVT
ncbi:hypothetical protein T484DRAFT_1772819 [Baffinella frigidus]|nr:hypothetical protein T484DRAFT_1772819 [Cryptophyta sp. CCMP2293]